jgi:hypothetical protein
MDRGNTYKRVIQALSKADKLPRASKKKRATKQELNELKLALNKLIEKWKFQEFRDNKRKKQKLSNQSYSGFYKLVAGHKLNNK